MARTDTLGHFLTDVADSIRTKAGTSEPIQASAFDTAILNIPSGSSEIEIHGIIVNKTIIDGNISKGDFVCLKNYLPITRCTSDYTYTTMGTVTDIDDLFDNDNDTYATIKNSDGQARIEISLKSASDLGIPANRKITKIRLHSKFNKVSGGTTILAIITNTDVLCQNNSIGKNSLCYLEAGSIDNINLNSNDLQNCSFVLYSVGQSSSPAELKIYYIDYEIYYEDNGEIKKASSNDMVYGIANGDGTSGDTIPVYIPLSSNN